MVELTAFEIKIVRLICKQLTAKEIGAKLGFTYRTIEGYRLIIQRKIKARSIVGIALWAVKHNIVKV